MQAESKIRGTTQMSLDEAQKILDVHPNASLAEIRKVRSFSVLSFCAGNNHPICFSCHTPCNVHDALQIVCYHLRQSFAVPRSACFALA